MFFQLFAVIFENSFLYSVDQGIKAKYVLLELKVPWPMSAISETYNRARYISEIVYIYPKVPFLASETKRD